MRVKKMNKLFNYVKKKKKIDLEKHRAIVERQKINV